MLSGNSALVTPRRLIRRGQISDRGDALAHLAYLWFKRALDVLLALAILIALFPLMLGISLAIVFDTGFPIFFCQERRGKNNVIFRIYKFRTMRCGPELRCQATSDDERITRIGRFLRRSSLDELPQIANVLSGHMSLVGPRPHPLWLDDRFCGRVDQYFRRTMIKPGITGLAQVSGARGETKDDADMEKRVKLDLQYIDQCSIGLDMKILVRTALLIWFDSRAY